MEISDKKIKSSILISGGSGLVGSHLIPLLLSKGYNVSCLSRGVNHDSGVNVYKWDPERRIIDYNAIEGIDYIIHLAGANIGEKRWTKKRKEEIVRSRVNSAIFLHHIIREKGLKLKAFISASAVGYYGLVTTEKVFREEDPPSNDYLGTTCRHWEEAADLFSKSDIRTIKIRTAVVLEKNDSALSKLMKSGKYGFLVRTGNGRQYIPWIHIDDLCNIYLKAIGDSNMSGAYNAASTQQMTHKDFMRVLAQVMKKPVFLPAIPAFIMRAFLGEMSNVILKGSRVSSEKIIRAGYKFVFNNLEDALNDIVNR
jgi:uncharacterized protein (TIGR01777 family)